MSPRRCSPSGSCATRACCAAPVRLGAMASERDLFANFERMRREMEELFGDVLERRLTPRRHDGFMPAVDVYYAGNPPRAVVRADLAGVDPADGDLEIRGREPVLARVPRPPADAGDRV